MWLLFVLALCHALTFGLASSFHHNLHQVQKGHDKLASNQRLSALVGNKSLSTTLAIPTAHLEILATGDGSSFPIFQTQFLPNNPPPPSACADALTSPVTCNATIQQLGYNPYLDATTLANICTADCTSSLSSYRATVVSSCGHYALPGPNNMSYATTLAVDTIAGSYAISCRQDTTTGNFCNSVLPTYNTTSGILGYPQDQLCSSCVLGTLNATLSNELTYSDSLYNILQTALNTCGSVFASYNISRSALSGSPSYSTGPSTIPVGANATISPSCAITGRNVTTSGTNSTCAQIATTYSVSTIDVLTNNPTLRAENCTSGVGPGTQLCLPQACTTFAVNVNQTCNDVVTSVNTGALAGPDHNITFAQLVSFNPDLGSSCEEIANRVNNTICITPHGGFPNISSPSNIPKPSSTPTAAVPPPGPTVAGTTSSCGAWYLVKPNDFCLQVVLNNTITLDDFLILNPEVNANCTNLWAGYDYCVAPYPPLSSVSATPVQTLTANYTSFTMYTSALPTAIATTTTYAPLPTASISPPENVANGTVLYGCNFYYDVGQNDNCTSIENIFNITADDFNAWNPGVAPGCPSLTAGDAVCVIVVNATATVPPAPANVAPGTITKNCLQYYTVVSGDTCGVVEGKLGISDTQFRALNPELAADCSNLGLGQAYCVKVLTTTTSTSGTASPSTTPPPVPTNVEPGTITAGCILYYTVVSGDTCTVVETKMNITDAQFRALNPEINSDCSNLSLGAAYCIAASSSTSMTITTPPSSTTTSPSSSPTAPANLAPGSWSNCTAYHTVASGENCVTIETSAGIAIADFYRWNPELNTDCTNIGLGEAYCTAGSNPCPKVYTVTSGDFCSLIADNNGISVSQLLTLNPNLDSNCDLQIGWNLCVAIQ